MKKILFVGMRPKRSLSRQVECELEKWINEEQSALLPGKADYQIKVEREEAYPYYQCSVEVSFGPCKLKAQEGGKTLQAALSNSLRRMRVVSAPRKILEPAMPIQSLA